MSQHHQKKDYIRVSTTWFMLLFVSAIAFYGAIGCSGGGSGSSETSGPLPSESVCGDTVCSSDETTESCVEDCPAVTNSGCGNGTCDEGETIESCAADCHPEVAEHPRCGDGITSSGEACDDGNTNNIDECRNDCSLPHCRDGVIGPGEECDDGNESNEDVCLNVCVDATCGDGFVQTGVEQCDDGSDEMNEHTSCVYIEDAPAASCKNAICGDGYVRTGVETCDNTDADVCWPAGTLHQCRFKNCGDGIMDGEEECDRGDANRIDAPHDECTHLCTIARCGDGIQGDDGEEECDDGDISNNDWCLSTCRIAYCGDGSICNTFTPLEWTQHSDLFESCDGVLSPGGQPCTQCGYCGDGTCNPDYENASNCNVAVGYGDCSSVDGDSFCTAGENPVANPLDCPGACPDSYCTAAENTARTCPSDCSCGIDHESGNGTCEDIEKLVGGGSTCEADCPIVPRSASLISHNIRNITLAFTIKNIPTNTYVNIFKRPYVESGDGEFAINCPTAAQVALGSESPLFFVTSYLVSCPVSSLWPGYLRCTYTDSSVSPGTKYCYVFSTETRSAGRVLARSYKSGNYFATSLADETGFDVDVSYSPPRSVQLSWDSIATASSYEVFSGNDQDHMDPISVLESDVTTYTTHQDLKLGKIRYYKVVVRYGGGATAISRVVDYTLNSLDTNYLLTGASDAVKPVVAIDDDRMIVAGGNTSGDHINYFLSIYSKRSNGDWEQDTLTSALQGRIRGKDIRSVDISGDYAVVGIPKDHWDEGGAVPGIETGRVIVLHRSGSSWDEATGSHTSQPYLRNYSQCGRAVSLATRGHNLSSLLPTDIQVSVAILCSGNFERLTGAILSYDLIPGAPNSAASSGWILTNSTNTRNYPYVSYDIPSAYILPQRQLTDGSWGFNYNAPELHNIETDGYTIFVGYPNSNTRRGSAVFFIRKEIVPPAIGARFGNGFLIEWDSSPHVITPSSPADNAFFGYSVARKNNQIAFGSPGNSTVYKYGYTTSAGFTYFISGSSIQDASLPFLGNHIAMTNDYVFASSLTATASNLGRIFGFDQSSCDELFRFYVSPPPFFGGSIDVQEDGGYLAVGASNAWYLY